MDSTGGGVWKCTSPTGTSGQPLLPGDVASVAVDLYAPLALGAVIVNIDYYTSAGVYISSDSSPSQAMTAGQIFTVQVRSASGGAPATTAYCAISIEDNETKASGTFLYIDNVRYSPRMGVQTRKRLQDYIKEVTALEQGLLKESKELVGLGYRTRFSLINQTPALTLDYSLGHLSGQLQPVFDDLLTNTFVVVKRDAGSTIITTTTGTGGGSNIHVTISPNPVYIAETDDQLAALAAHLLNLGTDVSERYPQISVDLSRSELSSLIGQISQVDIGDMIEIINLPFWYPSSTTQQIVIGYTEVVNAFKWQITWNCKPATPWNIAVSSIRRW
jgi:hypothetical protein